MMPIAEWRELPAEFVFFNWIHDIGRFRDSDGALT